MQIEPTKPCLICVLIDKVVLSVQFRLRTSRQKPDNFSDKKNSTKSKVRQDQTKQDNLAPPTQTLPDKTDATL